MRILAAAKLTAWIIRHRRRLVAIHANGLTELHLAAPGAILARVPVVAWFHAYELGSWDRSLGPIWRRLVPAPRLAAVSDTARRVVVEARLATQQEVALIPNPIDPNDVRAPHRADDALRGEPLVVGYMGSTIIAKGFHLLPDIVERLHDAPVRWLLFTNQPSAMDNHTKQAWSRLEAAGRDRLTFVGRVQDIPEAYEQCDAIICPSLRESFGRIAAEAMASGLPVVASDIEPFRDVIGDGEAGLLFPPSDVDAAAKAVRRLIAEPALRQALGKAGRARSAALEPGVVVPRLAELYRLPPR